jgi:ferredoxin
MRVKIDWDACEGNGICMSVAPTVFELDDEDQMHLLIEEPSESLRAQVEQAAAGCPKAAITVLD